MTKKERERGRERLSEGERVSASQETICDSGKYALSYECAFSMIYPRTKIGGGERGRVPSCSSWMDLAVTDVRRATGAEEEEREEEEEDEEEDEEEEGAVGVSSPPTAELKDIPILD